MMKKQVKSQPWWEAPAPPATKKPAAVKKRAATKKPAAVKKRAATKKPAKKRVGTLERLRAFTQALVELYPCDEVRPGVVLAWLPDDLGQNRDEGKGEGVFYASAARYETRDKKVILASAKAPALERAILEMVENWRRGTRRARKVCYEAARDRYAGVEFGHYFGQDD